MLNAARLWQVAILQARLRSPAAGALRRFQAMYRTVQTHSAPRPSSPNRRFRANRRSTPANRPACRRERVRRVHELQRHVAVTSTLPVFEMFVPGRPTIQQRVLDALSPDARTAFLNNKVRAGDASAIQQRYHSDSSPWPAAFKKEMEFEHAFAQAGGLLLAGLDPTGMGGVIAGFGDQREVELLVEAGFTPLEAIHIATANGAQFFGEQDRIGTIATGKQADLVVVKGDPSKRIEDIENVETVFKDGIGYDSQKLIESVRGVVGSR